MRQFHFFCKQRYLKYTVLSLLLCPLSSSAAEEWKEVKGESTTNIVESTQQKKQKRVITGVVRDSDTNEPIIGASVWLKNSSVGAVTDIDGKYSITIEGVGGVLEFSYIGMKSKRIKYTGQARLDIVMESDAQTMDEIVVQADRLDRDNMGITARQQVSATQKVTMDELVAVSPVTSLEDALQGQLGGVDIVLGGGDPGTPHTPATERMINQDTLAKMKDGVILINTARGALIDEQVLADALASGKVLAAGLDVLTDEPPVCGSPLLTAPNTVITGHIAWLTRESRIRAIDMAIDNFRCYLEGHPVSIIN